MSKLISKNINVLQELKSHVSDVTCVEFWGNVLLVTGSSDKTVRVWKWIAKEGFVEETFSPLQGHKYGITSVKISPQGGILASASVDGTIALWDVTTGEKSHTLFQENAEAVRACCFSPDGSWIAAADDSGTVCVWGQDKNLLKVFKFHEETVYTVAFSPDSSVLLTACAMGNIRLTMLDFNSEGDQINDCKCSVDNAHDLGVLSADFCKFIHTDPSDHDTTIYTAATCGTDQSIKLWRIYCLRNTKHGINSSRLVPNTPSEHVSGTSTIYSTHILNTECVLTIQAHGSSVTCVKFNYRGTMLVSCSLDKTIKLWDLQGNCLSTLAGHSRYVNCVTINADSSIVASGSNDRTVLIWDLTSSLTLDSHLAGPRTTIFNLACNKIDIPLELICPITHEIMQNPVTAEDGFSYERSAIEEWFERGKISSPMTNAELSSTELAENSALKLKIDKFLKDLDFDPFDGTT